MLLNEVMKQTGLSRKAIQYYEDNGFIQPSKLENGYRDYDVKCVDTLTYIHEMRTLGLNMERIRRILLEDAYAPQVYEEVIHEIDQKTNLLHRQKDILQYMVKKQRPTNSMWRDLKNEHPYFYTQHIGLLNGGIFLIFYSLFLALYPVLPIVNVDVLMSLLALLVVMWLFRAIYYQVAPWGPKNFEINVKKFFLLIITSLLECFLLISMVKYALHIPTDDVVLYHKPATFIVLFILFSSFAIYHAFRPFMIVKSTDYALPQVLDEDME